MESRTVFVERCQALLAPLVRARHCMDALFHERRERTGMPVAVRWDEGGAATALGIPFASGASFQQRIESVLFARALPADVVLQKLSGVADSGREIQLKGHFWMAVADDGDVARDPDAPRHGIVNHGNAVDCRVSQISHDVVGQKAERQSCVFDAPHYRLSKSVLHGNAKGTFARGICLALAAQDKSLAAGHLFQLSALFQSFDGKKRGIGAAIGSFDVQSVRDLVGRDIRTERRQRIGASVLLDEIGLHHVRVAIRTAGGVDSFRQCREHASRIVCPILNDRDVA